MLLRWLRKRRRARLLRQPFPAAWTETVNALGFVGRFDAEERRRFEDRVRLFVDQIYWEGRDGLEVTDEMRVLIAAQACRMTLNLPEDAYRRARTVYLFPATYSAPGQTEDGLQAEGRSHRHGEAWLRGPIVLSWDAAQRGVANERDGRNVVYHEFAHKLDMLDGYADGVPPQAGGKALELWNDVTEREYEALVDAAQRNKKTLLDKYGATNRAEFFAVATEMFFERPQRLKSRHPELYDSLVRFYRQEPSNA